MSVTRGYIRACVVLYATIVGTSHAQTAPTRHRNDASRNGAATPNPTARLGPHSILNSPRLLRRNRRQAPFFRSSESGSQATSVFPAKRLEALVSKYAGHSTSLAQLRQGARRRIITRFYRAHDYPLARAFVPSQVVRDGVVEIAVLEGHYGKLRIDNPAGVSDRLVRRLLRNAQSPNSHPLRCHWSASCR